MSEPPALGLFEGVGLELEYMIVGSDELNVRAITDEVLHEVTGAYEQEAQFGPIGWSNELALHVIEIKNVEPVARLDELPALFKEQVNRINALLTKHDAQLLPTAMHPWMDPNVEFKLWPHGDRSIYATLDRIFDCKGHGWANLQSVHLNLPFANDDEFATLHAAIRMVLPLIPALAASSPFVDGRFGGHLDTRLEVYRTNAARVPSVAGKVIPEAVFSRDAYETELLQRIYRDLAPHDPEGVLRHEWVNSRGCIARFDRMAIEIRVTDVQECPSADVAIAAAVTAAVRAMAEAQWCSRADQQGWHEDELATVFTDTTRRGDGAVIDNSRYLEAFGVKGRSLRAGELWQHLIETTIAKQPGYAQWAPTLRLIQQEGCLARRILADATEEPTRDDLVRTYRKLARCLATGELFRPGR